MFYFEQGKRMKRRQGKGSSKFSDNVSNILYFILGFRIVLVKENVEN